MAYSMKLSRTLLHGEHVTFTVQVNATMFPLFTGHFVSLTFIGECFKTGEETPSTEWYNEKYGLQCTCVDGGWKCDVASEGAAQKRVRTITRDAINWLTISIDTFCFRCLIAE